MSCKHPDSIDYGIVEWCPDCGSLKEPKYKATGRTGNFGPVLEFVRNRWRKPKGKK